MRDIQVHLLPELVTPDDLSGELVIVIDVLRATTVMIHALAAGARDVCPCREVARARQLAARRRPPVLLAGERRGVRIEGFDLGNSPSEFSAAVVQGASVVMTTTNGTRALAACDQAASVVVAGFVNLSAVADVVGRWPGTVHLLCAGTDRRVALEDTLLAGALIHRLNQDGPPRLSDAARIAHTAWQETQQRMDADRKLTLKRVLQAGQGGQNVTALGLEADIEAAAQLDSRPVVPTLDPQNGCLRLPETRPAGDDLVVS